MGWSIAWPQRTTVDRTVLRAAVAVTAAGVVVKLIATGKEFVVAGIYGRSDAMDAFLAAFLIPNLLVNLIAESMNQALIPTLIRVRLQEGIKSAQELLSGSMLSLCLLLAAASGAMALLARVFFPLIAWNFPAAKLELSIRLFYALLPVVLLSGIASHCTAVWNSLERFAQPALAPVLVPLCTVIGVLMLRDRFGIWALVIATLAGTAAHALVTGWGMSAHGYAFQFRWHGRTDAMHEVAGQYGPVFLSSVVASGGLLVDQAMAAALPSGSVSALVFAGRFVGAAVTLMAGAISSAVTPYFSRMIAEQDWAGCHHALRRWSFLTALVSVPVAAALMIGSKWLVRATFQHGAFGAQDSAVVAPVLAMYAIQIPFYSVSRVSYRLLVAMRRTDLVLYCGIINLGLDVVLDLSLMRWMGIPGLALATSIWTISTFCFLWFWARRLLSRVETPTKSDNLTRA